MGAGRELVTEMRRTGKVLRGDGSEAPLTSGIDDACGELLRRMVLRARPSVAVEVGLAFGVSTLFILDALDELGGGKLIGSDPAQNDAYWRGGGLRNVEQAGLSKYYEFHEETSQQLLPRLEREGLRIQLGFVDGWHTFDHTLVDFFYLDRVLDDGGLIVFDDVGYPAIRRVCDFVLTNRSYELVEGERFPARRTSLVKSGLKRAANAAFGWLTRTDRTPGAAARRAQASIDDVYFAAFRKRGADSRRFDHFVPF